jgi:hypothetical protein
MSGHALFSPSAAHRWIECPGSFAYPANTQDGGSSSYADDGTASHWWASEALRLGEDAEKYIGDKLVINGATYAMDEDRAGHIQSYLDMVRQLALGKHLYVEHWVDLSDWLGKDQGGTCDAGIIEPGLVTAADFKYGMGEKVEAFYLDANGEEQPNHQLGLYAAGLVRDAELLGYTITGARLVVSQPRIGNHSEKVFPVAKIMALMDRAAYASGLAGACLVQTPQQAEQFMNPGDKTCRWCRAKAECPKLAKFVADETRSDFETIAADPPGVMSTNKEYLGKAMVAVPLIRQWCTEIEAETAKAVQNGIQITGSDGKPLKFVEGKMGNRKWADEAAAEAALVGQLAEKAYEPKAIITASAAAKLLDKKKTAALWNDVFSPLITRAPGKPILALGSDERPPYTGKAEAQEFDDVAPV